MFFVCLFELERIIIPDPTYIFIFCSNLSRPTRQCQPFRMWPNRNWLLAYHYQYHHNQVQVGANRRHVKCVAKCCHRPAATMCIWNCTQEQSHLHVRWVCNPKRITTLFLENIDFAIIQSYEQMTVQDHIMFW